MSAEQNKMQIPYFKKSISTTVNQPLKPGELPRQPFFPRYYDKPDGEDLVGKLIATTRPAFIIGSGYGLIDIVLNSKNAKNMRGFQACAGRYLYFTGPAVGMAYTFTFATYAAVRARGKDDIWNYVIGGYAAGGILGMWLRTTYWGWFGGTVFAFAGFLKKHSVQNGWEFFRSPETINQGHDDFRGVNRDYSIFAELDKGWIAGTRAGDDKIVKK